MTKDKALKLALEIALDKEYQLRKTGQSHMIEPVITAIKEALAQPEQEPVAWLTRDSVDGCWYATANKVGNDDKPLYTTPPQRPWVLQREWVDLTDEEIDKWAHELHGVIYAVMADLKEKNNG